MQLFKPHDIKAIIGLGNPGKQYEYTRHNIGFRIVDELAHTYHGSWKTKDLMELSSIEIKGNSIYLIKPLTFMNSSGKVIPWLSKQGIDCNHILVVHDELEQPFGKPSFKNGGSARGHNGLRSIIEFCGDDFPRLRFGISRPAQKEMVGNYVLENFSEPEAEIESAIGKAVATIESLF